MLTSLLTRTVTEGCQSHNSAQRPCSYIQEVRWQGHLPSIYPSNPHTPLVIGLCSQGLLS